MSHFVQQERVLWSGDFNVFSEGESTAINMPEGSRGQSEPEHAKMLLLLMLNFKQQLKERPTNDDARLSFRSSI